MPLQIVIDTNVVVSALRSKRGASFKLLSLVGKSTEFEINVSVPLVLEYEDVANRQLHITGLSAQDIGDIIDYLCSVANRRQIFFLWRPFLKDPKDDMVLELAVEAQCQYIISFNRRDFAGVEQFGLQVLTPQEFLKEIGEHDEHNQPETS
jgi:putative PIN family toxin of toxin-antitoxin system